MRALFEQVSRDKPRGVLVEPVEFRYGIRRDGPTHAYRDAGNRWRAANTRTDRQGIPRRNDSRLLSRPDRRMIPSRSTNGPNRASDRPGPVHDERPTRSSRSSGPRNAPRIRIRSRPPNARFRLDRLERSGDDSGPDLQDRRVHAFRHAGPEALAWSVVETLATEQQPDGGWKETRGLWRIQRVRDRAGALRVQAGRRQRPRRRFSGAASISCCVSR